MLSWVTRGSQSLFVVAPLDLLQPKSDPLTFGEGHGEGLQDERLDPCLATFSNSDDPFVASFLDPDSGFRNVGVIARAKSQ